MRENIIRNPVCLVIFALAILIFSSCGNGGEVNTTQAQGSRTATLSWDAPTTNEDGTQLDDLAGYKIYYGTTERVYGEPVIINDSQATGYTVENISPGTYYFAVTAFDLAGNESEYSNEVSKTIQ